MPLYDYYCDECDESFEVIKGSLDKEEVLCPNCEKRATKLISRLATGTSRAGVCAPGSGGSWGGG